jgi:hypothetical protein
MQRHAYARIEGIDRFAREFYSSRLQPCCLLCCVSLPAGLRESHSQHWVCTNPRGGKLLHQPRQQQQQQP